MRFIVPLAAAFCLSACAAQTSQGDNQTVTASGGRAAGETAAANAAALPDVDIPYQRFVLPNGLTLLVHEDHKTPVVALNVWYHVGSKNEPVGRHGFAHLFEHLMFEGSQHFDKDYFQVLEPAGVAAGGLAIAQGGLGSAGRQAKSRGEWDNEAHGYSVVVLASVESGRHECAAL